MNSLERSLEQLEKGTALTGAKICSRKATEVAVRKCIAETVSVTGNLVQEVFGLPNCLVKDVPGMGRGVFALRDLKKGDLIADWFDGVLYTAEKATLVPQVAVNHAVQISENSWIDTKGLGRDVNHSCDPNVAFTSTFQLRAIKDILIGEQVCSDYETFEDSDWEMECECRCGFVGCRKRIGAFSNLSQKQRLEKAELLHPWLREKYGI